MGYETSIYSLNSNHFKLKTYGEYNYDHLILICTDAPGKKLLIFT